LGILILNFTLRAGLDKYIHMLEVNDLYSLKSSNFVNTEDSILNECKCIENSVLKAISKTREISVNLQSKMEIKSNENCIISSCLVNINNIACVPYLNDWNFESCPFQEYKETMFCDYLSMPKNNTEEIKVKKTGSAWLNHWEIKCKEWLYRDRSDFEIINFAKKTVNTNF